MGRGLRALSPAHVCCLRKARVFMFVRSPKSTKRVSGVRGGAGEVRMESATGTYRRTRLAVERAKVFTVSDAWRAVCLLRRARREN
jgi:hypothetical protein